MLIKNKIVYCFAVCLFIFDYSNALNISILFTPSNFGIGGYFYPNLVDARVGDNIIFEKTTSFGSSRIVEANEKGSCVRSNRPDAYVIDIPDKDPRATLQLTKSGTFFLFDDGINENCISYVQCELDLELLVVDYLL
ncbi:9842_t:CDS:2 [Entrophospora sp. SA101]|nr:9833_t:CDS:2 [Entrophospora sp. SA101]CAJ0855075.1 9839_t:CDS:2 [Entrophospora sp. SA101]CAJ0855107.1 9842_t:CDS:2 [Entrophospora sp. SA101]